jgi:hypothetical protein
VNTPIDPPNLKLSLSERVTVSHQYYDGWCFGKNLDTGEEGTFPVGFVNPLFPIQITLFRFGKAEEYIGDEIIRGCLNAYRELFTVHNFHREDLTVETISPLLVTECSDYRIFTCGPPEMNSAVESVVAKCGIKHGEVFFSLGDGL